MIGRVGPVDADGSREGNEKVLEPDVAGGGAHAHAHKRPAEVVHPRGMRVVELLSDGLDPGWESFVAALAWADLPSQDEEHEVVYSDALGETVDAGEFEEDVG